MKLLIVESPGKIKKLRSFLGTNWNVMASIGHLCDLPKKQLGVLFGDDKIRLSFEVNPDKQEVVDKLRMAAARAAEIFLATDPDREGEAIAYHIGLLLGREQWGKIKRVSFNAISKEAVQHAVNNPRKTDMALVHAQQARRVVDRLVGYQVSPLLWEQDGCGSSAGRVQSVAVKLVVDREREIRNFVPVKYWTLEALLSSKEEDSESNRFKAKLIKYDNKLLVNRVEDGKEGSQRIVGTKEEMDAIMASVKPGPWKVIKREQKRQKRKPPAPFVTSSLQQAAHTKLRWSATKTMKVAQSLYEKGLITYMRTDSPMIAPDALSKVRAYIADKYPEEYLPKKPHSFAARDKRSQESHECIRPVDVQALPLALGNVNGDERGLYDLIWNQYLACQMAEAEYDTGTISISAPKALFQVKGRQLVFDGWTLLLGDATVSRRSSSKTKEADQPLLPPVEKGQLVHCHDLIPGQSETKPPLRYSEARLIKAMEVKSVGRPSTYAAILKNIQSRKYIEEKKRLLHATSVGEGLCDYLMTPFGDSFMDIAFTARMESSLDKVADGDEFWEAVVRAFQDDLKERLSKHAPQHSPTSPCPKCGAAMRRRKGRHGVFLGCSAYPECTHTQNVAA